MIPTIPMAQRPGRHPAVLLATFCLAVLAGCGTQSDQPAPLAITGTYKDEFYGGGFGAIHTINSTTWRQDNEDGSVSLFRVLSYSNDARYLIAHNDPANAFSPDLYSRFDWTFYSGALYYCTTAYNALTPGEALAGQADPNNPTTGGCNIVNNFPWTRLDPQ
jgi:hypothetical protein